MKKTLSLAFALVLAACGSSNSSIVGTYSATTVDKSWTFQADGTAIESNHDHELARSKYTIVGDKILLDGFDSYQLRVQPDGGVASVSYGRLVKK